MRYARYEKGKIVEGPKGLPKNWRNISNFNRLSNKELKKYRWYPVVDGVVPANHVVLSRSYTFSDDKIVESLETDHEQNQKSTKLKIVENSFLTICEQLTGKKEKASFAVLREIVKGITDATQRHDTAAELLALDAEGKREGKREGGSSWWDDIAWHDDI